MPTVSNGDLMVVVITTDGDPTVTESGGAGWTKMGQTSQSTNVTGAIFWKVADGSGDNFTAALTASEALSAVAFRIVNYGTPAGLPITGTATTGSAGDVNPPNHTPPGGAKNYLWIVTNHGDDARTVNAAPTNYDEIATQLGVSGGAGTSTAQRELNAASENPGAWNSSLSFEVGYTLAIEPV